MRPCCHAERPFMEVRLAHHDAAVGAHPHDHRRVFRVDYLWQNRPSTGGDRTPDPHKVLDGDDRPLAVLRGHRVSLTSTGNAASIALPIADAWTY